jgi:hypothetical protein
MSHRPSTNSSSLKITAPYCIIYRYVTTELTSGITETEL